MESVRFSSFFKSRKATLVVFAHPDDEVMFFLPAISSLLSSGHEIVVACLSNGGADGLGAVRKLEFDRVMSSLFIEKYFIFDDKRIPDGFHKWDVLVVKELVESVLAKHPQIDTIITFDRSGVSGHPNHVSVCDGVRLLNDKLVLELITIPTLVKFLVPPIDLLTLDKDHLAIWLPSLKVSSTMQLYESQNVWFRRLFAFFSRYAYVNTFKVRQAKVKGQ